MEGLSSQTEWGEVSQSHDVGNPLPWVGGNGVAEVVLWQHGSWGSSDRSWSHNRSVLQNWGLEEVQGLYRKSPEETRKGEATWLLWSPVSRHYISLAKTRGDISWHGSLEPGPARQRSGSPSASGSGAGRQQGMGSGGMHRPFRHKLLNTISERLSAFESSST